jgi:aldehyde:ferredoxin oxidoreductase
MSLTAWMGRILFIDLSTGKITEESPGEEVYSKYLGGYGLGAYILYMRQKPRVDPLSQESMLGFLTGPLLNRMDI